MDECSDKTMDPYQLKADMLWYEKHYMDTRLDSIIGISPHIPPSFEDVFGYSAEVYADSHKVTYRGSRKETAPDTEFIVEAYRKGYKVEIS